MLVWINGSLVDIRDAKVGIFSHSFSRGTAIFEVLEIVTNKKGTALLGLQQHLERFANSAKAMHINLPYTNSEIIKAITSCAKANRVANGFVKFFAYFDDFELTIIPHSTHVSFAILCIDYKDLSLNIEELSKPARAMVSNYVKTSPQSIPSHIKVTGSYVNGFRAQLEAKQKGYTDAILLDTNGNIAEAAAANIFFVKGQSIQTPTLESILPGITRMIVLDILRHENMECFEIDIPVRNIHEYTEAFFSGSVNTIQPIASINDITFNPVPGTISQMIQDKVSSLIYGNHPLSDKYLYYF